MPDVTSLETAPLPTGSAALAREVERRRTFAIISHPDAGKTTLTEKLLLYAGAVEMAGAVRTKGKQRHARSDWMEMEKTRGISVTSTVLQFDFEGRRFNLLDTPGHQDFSEDTYRVLTAVDSVVMVLDAAKGVEAQTIKLFEVCRQRGLPVLTFVNKLDQPGREPLELLDEIEDILGMTAVPVNWPIGQGREFVGVYDLERSEVLRFERVTRGERAAPLSVSGIDDPQFKALVSERVHAELVEEVNLLDMVVPQLDRQAFLEERQTPVFFGSALNNFGVEQFLDALVDLAPPPAPRDSDRGIVPPTADVFSGFVFKIQANMDPQHRDSMAFLRVVSGRFEKDMTVAHSRHDKPLRLPRAHRVFAQERESTEEAYPGDVVGLINPGLFSIGDTVSDGERIAFDPVPRFPPEHFARLRPTTIQKQKAFRKGLKQMEEEGAVQVLYDADAVRREPILAAVGVLQFDVVRARLANEYKVETHLDVLPYSSALWARVPPEDTGDIEVPLRGALKTRDRDGQAVFLAAGEWAESTLREKNPDVEFSRTP